MENIDDKLHCWHWVRCSGPCFLLDIFIAQVKLLFKLCAHIQSKLN